MKPALNAQSAKFRLIKSLTKSEAEMKSQGDYVQVEAGDLASALRPVLKARKRNALVELSYDAPAKSLQVEEAKQGLFSNTLPAHGKWNVVATMEGPRLAMFAARFAPEAKLQIVVRDGALHITSNGSQASLPCHSLKAVATKKVVRIDPRHKGKVEERPEGRHITPKGDTWDFSAQMPFREADWD